jgi:hypothetical protein
MFAREGRQARRSRKLFEILTSLIAVVCAHRVPLAYHAHQNLLETPLIMVSIPPFNFDHRKGFEILAKHKEVIRQLHLFREIPKF